MKRYTLAGVALTLFSAAALAQSGGVTGGATTGTDPNSLPMAPAIPSTDAPNDRLRSGASAGNDDMSGKARGGIDADKGTGKASTSLTGKPDFGKLDLDTDGKLTKKELSGDADLTARFDKLDTNSDGNLDSKEFAASTTSSLPR